MQKKVLAIILQLPRKKAKYINQNKVERETEGVESLKGERPILPPNPQLICIALKMDGKKEGF